jgi:L-threonylcarbamoyladenylate synthase
VATVDAGAGAAGTGKGAVCAVSVAAGGRGRGAGAAKAWALALAGDADRATMGGVVPRPQATMATVSGIAAHPPSASHRERAPERRGCGIPREIVPRGGRMARAKDARYLRPMARVLVVDARAPDAGIIAEAAQVLRRGGLVAMPTETVYGLAARALDEHAVARVYAAKGRPSHHPLIAHVANEAQARGLAAAWPARASRLARAFWPGPLTVIVDRAADVPAAVSGGGPSIALRAPSHRVALALLAALGEPLAAPSANRFQGLSPTTARHVVKQLGDAVDLVLDAGPCEAGIESTVIDLRPARARVLRPGALDLAALRGLLPDLETRVESVRGDQPRAAPGMESRHYAPRARLRVADTGEEARRIACHHAGAGEQVGLVTHEPGRPVRVGGVLARTLPSDPALYARLLYGTLHELDDAGVDLIVVQSVPQEEAWWAVSDRLRRGSTE